MNNGVLCPEKLSNKEDDMMHQKELWSWFTLHSQLLASIYMLLADERVKEISVLP